MQNSEEWPPPLEAITQFQRIFCNCYISNITKNSATIQFAFFAKAPLSIFA